jgi:hypothetical protein
MKQNQRIPRPQGKTPRVGATPPSANAPPRRSTGVAGVLGFMAVTAVGGAFAWSSGCGSEPPPGASAGDATSHPAALAAPPSLSTTAPNNGTLPAPSARALADAVTDGDLDAGAADAAEEVEAPYTGPLLGGLAMQTPIYPTTEFGKKRIGYIRLGGKVPVDPTPIKKDNCKQGWYRLLDGGFVCGRYATTDMSNPQVRLGIKPPNLDDLLPYKYAYNTAHGTPLYRSVPSKADMLKYEPYLEAAKKARRAKAVAEAKSAEAEKEPVAAKSEPEAQVDAKPAAAKIVVTDGDEAAQARDKANAAAEAAALGLVDGGVLSGDEGAVEPEKPWWQRKYEKGTNPNVKLEELAADSDSTIAKRMVKGFFVAVDKTFSWNSRSWYKTTSTLVAPADRMFINKPPSSQGIELPEGVRLAGFILSTKASKYELDEAKSALKIVGPIERFAAFGLTGETAELKSNLYRKTTDGWWMRAKDGTFAEPSPPPADLAPGEKWVDVNIATKTLLLMVGDRPVYAALNSPGRRSKIKKKNHATPTGTFRIREKHIAVTMDGDGVVAGDLPYSIEDVPFVQYYEGSYALHAAFWHSNFGREMSHGCVNLSPLDAKRVFFWTEPKLPRGWHGVWSTPEHRGTLVVIHE